MTDRFLLIVQPETELDRHLPVIDRVIFDIAAGFHDLEPVNIVECLAGLLNGILYRVFNARLGRPSQFNLFVDMLAHTALRSRQFARAVCKNDTLRLAGI